MRWSNHLPAFLGYIITDLKLFSSSSRMLRRIDYLLGLAPQGCFGVCLRESDLDDRRLLDLAVRLRKLTMRHAATLLVARRLDVALACGADGAHLGARTISIGDARRLVGRNFIIGYSAHGAEEAARAFEEGADFVTISPVFSSPGKGPPLGLSGLKAAVESCAGKPVFALGGVGPDEIGPVLATGAAGVAFIRAALISKRPSKLAHTLVAQSASNLQATGVLSRP